MKLRHLIIALASFCMAALLHAQVPQIINYQGRVAVGTVNFDGTGQFKFALVNGSGSTTYWSNDGTSTAGSQPTAAVSLTVTKGLYSVLLGDQGVTNMTAIPSSVFANGQLRLRVWFDDGVNGFQRLTPDQRLAPSAYLADGAVTSAKLASGAVGSAQLAPGALLSSQRVTGTTQLAQANSSYTATDAARVTITLPTTANIGDTVRVLGASAGGWSIAPNSGQSILGISATAGVSWTPHGPAKTWVRATSSADGNKLVAAAQSEYLYASADGGNSWNQLTSAGSREWKAVASSADGSKLFGVVVYGFLYTSTDSGATWTPRLADQTRSWLAGASSADGTKLVAAAPAYGIFTSTDSGATWTPHTAGLVSPAWSGLASSADGTKLVAVADGDRIYTSSDSGATWTPHGVSAPYKAVASSSDGSILVAVANFGQIYTSTDSGMNWTARESERAWYSVACSASGTNMVAVVYGGQIYTSADSGVTWTARETSRLWECVASSADGGTLVAGVDNYDYLYVSKGSLPLTGEQGSTAELQYLGNGQWQPVKQSLIATGAVGAAQIAGGAVGNAQLAANAVQAANIAAGAVGASQLENGSVGAAQLAAAAVTAANIAPGAIGSAQLAPNALTGANISIPLTLSGAPSFGLAKTQADDTGSGTWVILGENTASGIGVKGTSVGGDGIFGSSGKNGVHGQSPSTSDSGVLGENTSGTLFAAPGCGVRGVGSFVPVLVGIAARGVIGDSTNNDGVYGVTHRASTTRAGVVGENTAAGGTGVIGRAVNINSAGVAGIGDTDNSTGVYGRGTKWAGNFDGVVRVGNDNAGIRYDPDTDGPFVFGYTGGALGTVNPDRKALTWNFNNDVWIGGKYLTVIGGANEQAYLGADGAGNDVQIGSTNAAIDSVIAWNSARSTYMQFTCSVLHITGGSDLAEPFEMSSQEIAKGSVVVIDDEHPGRLKLSQRAYDRRVAGIVSGANGINPGIALHQQGALEGGQNVALSGRVYVQADASNGAIQPGDLLTTSDTPGHAMKATDHDRAQGAIIGKAMSALPEGTGMVLVLVTLQ